MTGLVPKREKPPASVVAAGLPPGFETERQAGFSGMEALHQLPDLFHQVLYGIR